MKYKNEAGISLSYEDKKDDHSLLIKEVVREGVRLIDEISTSADSGFGFENAKLFFQENFSLTSEPIKAQEEEYEWMTKLEKEKYVK